MQPQPVTASEIATMLRDIRVLTDNPTQPPEFRAAVLARKAEILARLAEQNNTEQDADEDDPGQGSADEPYVDVQAGLIGRTIELLAACDKLLTYPGQTVGPQPARRGTKWPHEELAATARELQSILDNAGIVVDPTPQRRY